MNSTVIYNKSIATDVHFLLRLKWSEKKIPTPGQFVMVSVSDASTSLDPLLRRPFSVFDAGKGWIELLYRVVGRGTSLMSTLKKGDKVDVLGPLGKKFPTPKEKNKLIMVAGGIGIAPFYLLSKTLKNSKKDAVLFFGARTKVDARLSAPIKKLGIKVKVSTEDGSLGRAGYVTDAVLDFIEKDSVIYACGPMGMLKATAKLAKDAGVLCYVSLESSMACGIGVCLGCALKASEDVKKTKDKEYVLVCSEGPVFNSKDIEWEKL
ncbi:MAG: dihydroorotate dehydrogenase electron transfer subunit [Deltaproteobacteria bacterium]|nr:dihydroorotate dehydrogenase electron transfer subunit [Deltaproteobacteria bacterium]